MIQVVSVSAMAHCDNCGGLIKRGKGDLDHDERWWHDRTGRAGCPDAPTAVPAPGTVRPTP